MPQADGTVVRAATPTDAGAICRIYNAALAERKSTFETEPRSADEFKSRIDNARFPLLVAATAEEIIGWAGLASYSSRPCYAGIGECSVYVAVEARGRGIGTSLTEALAESSREKKFHKLIGKLFTHNAASIRLVERCGFSSVGLHRRHGQLDGQWRDVLLVERLLES
jgi:phosphinothricin acetyltransferase